MDYGCITEDWADHGQGLQVCEDRLQERPEQEVHAKHLAAEAQQRAERVPNDHDYQSSEKESTPFNL